MFTYPNGDSYSGNWKWGKKHGKGTYIYKDTGMKVAYLNTDRGRVEPRYMRQRPLGAAERSLFRRLLRE